VDQVPVSPQLVEAVGRLWQVRAEMKALATEEAALRDAVLAEVADWPVAWFPVRAGGHDLRLSLRAGHLDAEAASTRLARLGLLGRVPREPAIKDPVRAREFPRVVARLRLGQAQEAVLAAYAEVVEWVPAITPDLLRGWRDAGALDPEDLAACFRDGRPQIAVLTVR
jgi:hypothetical protein